MKRTFIDPDFNFCAFHSEFEVLESNPGVGGWTPPELGDGKDDY